MPMQVLLFGTKRTQDEISSKSIFIRIRSLKELVSLFLKKLFLGDHHRDLFSIPTSYMAKLHHKTFSS